MAKTSKNIIDEARKDNSAARYRCRAQADGTARHRAHRRARERRMAAGAYCPMRSRFRAASWNCASRRKFPTTTRRSSSNARRARGRSWRRARSRSSATTNVYNLVGGFNSWKDRGLAVGGGSRSSRQDEITRYSRHFVIPEVGEKGQAKLLDSKVLLLGAGALGSSSALYLAAAGVGTIGLVDFDVVDLSNLAAPDHSYDRSRRDAQDRIGAKANQRAESRDQGESSRGAALVGKRDGHHQGLRRHRELRRQFPDALPHQRCVRVREEAAGGRRDFPLRRQGHRFLPGEGRPVLPMPLSRARAAGHGAVVRGGRRARRAAGNHRIDRSARDDQAAARRGRSAHRPDGLLRHAVGRATTCGC